jgi:hypothetical protein
MRYNIVDTTRFHETTNATEGHPALTGTVQPLAFGDHDIIGFSSYLFFLMILNIRHPIILLLGKTLLNVIVIFDNTEMP